MEKKVKTAAELARDELANRFSRFADGELAYHTPEIAKLIDELILARLAEFKEAT